jgi:hypothetical protein
MNTKLFKILLSGILIGSTLFAGTVRSHGTAGAAQLLIPVGAENIALSGSNVATVSGVEALWLNPAGIARQVDGFQVIASTMSYIADIKVANFGILYDIGSLGTIGAHFKSLDFGEIPITTATATEGTGNDYSPTFATLGLTYGKSFSDRVQFGANFKLVTEKIMNTGATGLAVDLGVQYKFPDLPLHVGVVLSNLGNKMEYTGTDLEQTVDLQNVSSGSSTERVRLKSESFEIPAGFDVSVNYEVIPDLMLLGGFKNNSSSSNTGSFGAKYNFMEIGWVGAGYQLDLVNSSDQPDDVDDADWDLQTQNVWGLTFGAGVAIPIGDFKVGIGYSYRQVSDYFSNNNLFQLTVDF